MKGHFSPLTETKRTKSAMQSSETVIQQAIESSHENVVNFPVKLQDECTVNAGEIAPVPAKVSKNQEIADYFGVKVRTVQNWSAAIRTAKVELLRDSDGCLTAESVVEYQKVKQLGEAAYLASYGIQTKQLMQTSTMEIPSVEAEIENETTALTVGSRGEITAQQSINQVQPLLQISIESLQIQLPQADVSGLNADTQKLQGINQQAIQVLTQYVSADLKSKVTELLSQNSNLAAAIQTAATVGAVQGIQIPKPQAEAAGTTS